jgi:hypothetical protein
MSPIARSDQEAGITYPSMSIAASKDRRLPMDRRLAKLLVKKELEKAAEDRGLIPKKVEMRLPSGQTITTTRLFKPKTSTSVSLRQFSDEQLQSKMKEIQSDYDSAKAAGRGSDMQHHLYRMIALRRELASRKKTGSSQAAQSIRDRLEQLKPGQKKTSLEQETKVRDLARRMKRNPAWAAAEKKITESVNKDDAEAYNAWLNDAFRLLAEDQPPRGRDGQDERKAMSFPKYGQSTKHNSAKARREEVDAAERAEVDVDKSSHPYHRPAAALSTPKRIKAQMKKCDESLKKGDRPHTPLVSEAQQRLFGAELARRRNGEPAQMEGITTDELESHLKEGIKKSLILKAEDRGLLKGGLGVPRIETGSKGWNTMQQVKPVQPEPSEQQPHSEGTMKNNVKPSTSEHNYGYKSNSGEK